MNLGLSTSPAIVDAEDAFCPQSGFLQNQDTGRTVSQPVDIGRSLSHAVDTGRSLSHAVDTGRSLSCAVDTGRSLSSLSEGLDTGRNSPVKAKPRPVLNPEDLIVAEEDSQTQFPME